MECSGQGPRPCSSPRATWWAGSCRVCEPTDDRARYGLPRGELLTPDRLCPACGSEWPEDSVCHRCSGPAAPVKTYWEALGDDRPPDVSAAAQILGALIDSTVHADESGELTLASVADLCAALGARGAVARWAAELAAGRVRMESQCRWLAHEEAEASAPKPTGRKGARRA